MKNYEDLFKDVSAEAIELHIKRQRREYLFIHLFEVLNFTVAVAALIVAIFGLFLP